MGDGDTMIVFTESGRLVDNARTIGICNVGVDNNAKSFIFILCEWSIEAKYAN